MSKGKKNREKLLSSALKENLKLRKKQILSRDKNNISGKRIVEVGKSRLIETK